MTIVEFLRARLDEDESVALATSPWPWESNAEGDEVLSVRIPGDEGLLDDDLVVAAGHALSNGQLRANVAHIARHDPARVLAEVAAKRAVIEQYEHKQQSMALYPNQGNANGLMAFDEVLRLLAAVYADHADYRSDWAPDE